MKIQTFIFNWNRQYQKTIKKESQLKDIGRETVVINSDDLYKLKHWHNIGNRSYFTAQFLKALEIFDPDADALFHIQADASYDNWQGLYEDAEKYFEKTNWGIYAPNVDYTWYDSSRTDIPNIEINVDNLRAVANPDCTCWFIHRDIINKFKERNLDFSPYSMGWCWDIVLCSLSYMNKRLVVRDYNHTISHPKGTNYNISAAEAEMWALYQSLPEDLQEGFRLVKGDRKGLTKYL